VVFSAWASAVVHSPPAHLACQLLPGGPFPLCMTAATRRSCRELDMSERSPEFRENLGSTPMRCGLYSLNLSWHKAALQTLWIPRQDSKQANVALSLGRWSHRYHRSCEEA